MNVNTNTYTFCFALKHGHTLRHIELVIHLQYRHKELTIYYTTIYTIPQTMGDPIIWYVQIELLSNINFGFAFNRYYSSAVRGNGKQRQV